MCDVDTISYVFLSSVFSKCYEKTVNVGINVSWRRVRLSIVAMEKQ